jgi:hypothetical protein
MRCTPLEAVNAFQQSDEGAYLAARYIRTKLDFKEQSFVLDKLLEDTPNVKKFLTGVCFANNWSEVWQSPSVATISSPQKALDWFVLIAKRNAKRLESHVKFRNKLNHAMLHGDWDVAKNILEQHQRVFGPTLWGLNWTILS